MKTSIRLSRSLGRFWCVLLSLAALGALTPRLAAQEPPIYMHVTEWQIPRAQWVLWEAFEESNVKPVLEKLMTDGRILDWGLYANELHSPNGPTHGLWFSAADMNGIQAALDAQAKIPTNSVMDNPLVKQRDFLFRKMAHGGQASAGSGAILWVHRTQSAAGKFGQSPAFWDKYLKPMLEELVARGAVVSYGMEIEQVRTQAAGALYIHCLLADASATDKFFSALDVVQSKMSAPERDEFNAVQVAEDQVRLGRVTSFGIGGPPAKK